MPTRLLSPPADRTTRDRLRFAALYVAAWLPMTVIYIGVLTTLTGGELSVFQVTIDAVLNTVGPALLGLGVWYMTGRGPLPKRLETGLVLRHIGLAVIFVSGWMLWQFVVLGPFAPARPSDPAFWRWVFPWQGIIGILLYALVAGISYAVRSTIAVSGLRITAATADRLRAEAELAALRAHLDPHFLFNTLHGVMQLLRENPAHAEQALERLADLLRFVLQLDRAKTQVVPLEHEWRFVSAYLWLEQLRLGDRLRVDASFDDDALGCAVPPFTLQPLVENAIRHGLSPLPAGGRLRISARVTDERLELEVADSGVGLASPPDESDLGLGLTAVVRRVRAWFGDANVRIDITTAPAAGFSIMLSIPARPMTADLDTP